MKKKKKKCMRMKVHSCALMTIESRIHSGLLVIRCMFQHKCCIYIALALNPTYWPVYLVCSSFMKIATTLSCLYNNCNGIILCLIAIFSVY